MLFVCVICLFVDVAQRKKMLPAQRCLVKQYFVNLLQSLSRILNLLFEVKRSCLTYKLD